MVFSQIELEKQCSDKHIKIVERTKLLEEKMDKLFFDRWCTKKKKNSIRVYFSEIKIDVPYGKFIEGWDTYYSGFDGSIWKDSYAKAYFTNEVIKDIIKKYKENGYDISFGMTFIFGRKYFEFKV